jgi:hypothetical protein
VGVGVPLTWGLSLNDYYFDARGGNATLGYFTTGVSASVVLPSPKRLGQWFLNSSFQYLDLIAANLRAHNDRRQHEFIGKVGVGFSF